jgi:hypothetical protein
LLERRLRLCELRAHRVYLGRTARFLEIGKRRFGLTHARLRFGARRGFLSALEHEQRRIRRHFVATIDGQPRKAAGERCSHAHVIGLDVAGIAGRR